MKTNRTTARHTRPRRLWNRAKSVFSIAIALSSLGISSTANAEFELSAGVDVAVPVQATADANGVGFGMSAGLAYGLPVPFVELSLGAMGGFTQLPTRIDGNADFNIGWVAGALALGVELKSLTPSTYLRLGYGSLSGQGLDFMLQSAKERTRRFVLHSGHDSTLHSLLSALGAKVWDKVKEEVAAKLGAVLLQEADDDA